MNTIFLSHSVEIVNDWDLTLHVPVLVKNKSSTEKLWMSLYSLFEVSNVKLLFLRQMYDIASYALLRPVSETLVYGNRKGRAGRDYFIIRSQLRQRCGSSSEHMNKRRNLVSLERIEYTSAFYRYYYYFVGVQKK